MGARLLLVVLGLAATACGEKDAERPAARDDQSGGATAEVAEDVAAQQASVGPVGPDRLVAAKRGVKPYDRWSEAWAHLTAAAGQPTAVNGETFGWYVRQDSKCFVLEVVRDEQEDRVDSVLYGPFDQTAPEFAKCGGSGSGTGSGSGK